jgi:protein-L-isoaspartate(D-aspartate) O-methyltransferase
MSSSRMIEQARHNMVEQQIRPWEVLDPRVLECFSFVPREKFVPAQHAALAFSDVELPLAHGEMMMKPVLEGRMLQALQLKAEDEVLEIGTGSGFITACLAHLSRSVHSIDIHADFVVSAKEKLHALGFNNVSAETADALNYQSNRQYDAICVTAAVEKIPDHFLQWLKPAGRLFIVRGYSPAMEALCVTRIGDSFSEESLFETDIAYLRGAAPTPEFTL